MIKLRKRSLGAKSNEQRLEPALITRHNGQHCHCLMIIYCLIPPISRLCRGTGCTETWEGNLEKWNISRYFGVKASRGNTGSGTDTSTGHFAPRVPQAAHQDRAGTFTCPYRHREKEVTDLRKSAN